MSGGLVAWAALMSALALIYLRGMKNSGLSAKRMVLIALIWVAVIGGGYLVVTALTGLQ